MLYDSVRTNVQNRQVYRDGRSVVASGCLLPPGRRLGVTASGYGVSFRGKENVLKLDRSDACEYTKKPPKYTL